MNFLNRCAWTPASAGTGDFVLSAALAGFYAPADCASPAVVDGGIYRYFAVSSDGSEHEEGDGAWDVGTSTLTRVTIRNSSNSGSKVDFTTAPTVHMGGAAAADMPGEELLGFVDLAAEGGASVVTLDADLREFLYVVAFTQSMVMDNSELSDGDSNYVAFQLYDADDTPLLATLALIDNNAEVDKIGEDLIESVGWQRTTIPLWRDGFANGSFAVDLMYIGTSGSGVDVAVDVGLEATSEPVTLKVESLHYVSATDDYGTPPNMTSGKIWFYGRRK
jgi:hypothetical protein